MTMLVMNRKGPGRVTMAEATKQMDEFISPESSNIHGAVFYSVSKVLRIRFKNSKGEVTHTYDYNGFAEDRWEEFKKAKSKGQYFSKHIRDQFKTIKVA